MDYFTVKGEVKKEITVKKSRFIAYCFHIESIENAEEKIKEVQKLNYKATHNTYAYVSNPKGGVFKYSDDGEPSLTAGKPIYDSIAGRNLTYTLIVVTRYFGGIKLGTGGLVRAYGQAAQDVLDEALIIKMQHNALFEIVVDYSSLGSVQNYFSSFDHVIEGMEYEEKVKIRICIPYGQKEPFMKDYTELTNGKQEIIELDEKFIEKNIF